MHKLALITDTQIFFTQRTGGASVYWYELLRRMLDDSRIEVHLLLANSAYDNIQLNQLDLSKAVIHKERVRSNNEMRLLSPAIPNTIELPKVFHSSYMRMPSRGNVIKIITVHDLIHQRFMSKLKAFPNTYLKQKAISRADGIISISQNTQKDLFDYFPAAENKTNTVIYNGASDDYCVDTNVTASPIVLEAASKPFILYIGRRNGYKNYKMVEETLNRVDDVRLVVVGGEAGYSTNLSDRTISLRGLSNTDLNYLYNKAICLFYPSLYEGFGIPVVEASKAGCPVIACNRSSIPEIAGETTSLLEPEDIDRAVYIINKLIHNPLSLDERLQSSQKASVFSWDACYERVIEFYERLIVEKA